MKLLLVLLTLSPAFCALYLNTTNVSFALVLYRHGDRTPIDPYPADPYAKPAFWGGLEWGQLTDLGKKQHYDLGLYFRARYSHLLSPKYRTNEVYVRSTDVDRTIMSAECNLAGLYPWDSKEEWIPGLAWSPVPVHTVPRKFDDLLCMCAECPFYQKLLDELFGSMEWKQMELGNKKLYDYLTDHTGRKIDSIFKAAYLYSNLFIEDLKNLSLPKWTERVYPEELRELAALSFIIPTFTPTMSRLLVGPFITDLTYRLGNATLNIGEKVVMYSAHDDTIANVLHALRLFVPHCPSYAAHVLFELIKEEEWSVRITYQDEVLEIPQCGYICPLEKWKVIYENLIYDDHLAECHRNDYNVPYLAFLLICFISLSIFLSLKVNNLSMQQYGKDNNLGFTAP